MRGLKVGWMCLLILISAPGITQEDKLEMEPEERARQAIRDLKDGVLVVRLASDARKLEAMQRIIDAGNISEKTEKRLRERMAITISERDEQAHSIRRSLEVLYGFSDVLYMYDTSQVHLQEGVQSGIFLDEDLRVDSSLSLKGRPWLVLYYGFTDRVNTSGIEAWILMDDTGEDLEGPFPYYVRVKGIGARVDDIEARHVDSVYLNSLKKNRLKGDDRIAWRLDQNMRGYYKAVGE